MSKIFPMRRFNPTKCRVDLPDPPRLTPPPEERQILRELHREAITRSLEKRAAALPPVAAIDADIKPTLTFYPPEFVQGLTLCSRRCRLRFIANHPKYRSMQDALPWLTQIENGAHAHCAGCGTDITVHLPGNVPWEVVAIGPPPFRFRGLCQACYELPPVEKAEKILTGLTKRESDTQ